MKNTLIAISTDIYRNYKEKVYSLCISAYYYDQAAITKLRAIIMPHNMPDQILNTELISLEKSRPINNDKI